MTDHVLTTIDQALDDWQTSSDAMRWTPGDPEALAQEQRKPGWQLRRTGLQGRDGVVTVTIVPDVTAFEEALREVARFVAHDLMERIRQLEPILRAYQRHETFARPKPLPIDGHAYRRRRRTRRC